MAKKNTKIVPAKKELSAEEIEEITKCHPMEYLSNHPLFLVRWIERNRRELLLKTIYPKPGEVIADIGCERGHMLSLINHVCPNVGRLYGIDISRHALDEARRVASWEGWKDKAGFIFSDATAIKLPDNSVDVAISSNVLEHLPDPEKGFEELVRITKPGGRIILNLPNEKRIIKLKQAFFKMKLHRMMGNLKLVTPGHLHYPDKNFVRKLCAGKADIKRLFLGPKISFLGLYIYAVAIPRK